MATSTAARKAKGRRLQQKVRDLILKLFPVLEFEDVVSTSMGAGGEDVKLSPAARKLFPYSIECKKNKRFAIYALYDQAVANSGKHEPLLVIEGDRKKALAIVSLEHFMELHNGQEVQKRQEEEK